MPEPTSHPMAPTQPGRPMAQAPSSLMQLVGLTRCLYDKALVAPCLSVSQRRAALAGAEDLTQLLEEIFREWQRPNGLKALQRAVDLRKELGGLEPAPTQTFGASMPKAAQPSLVGP